MAKVAGEMGRALQCRRRAVRSRGLMAIGAGVLIALSTTSSVAAHDPDWNQVDNIKEAATHLAQLQRTQGATKAFAFIDACYRTHSLASEYTKAFEACIAQDYLETQVLALVYSRLPPEHLKQMGAPSPQLLSETMARRVGAAFAQYKIPRERIAAFKRNVDEHGMPLLFKALFPNLKMPEPAAPPASEPPAAGSAPEQKKQ